MNYLQELAAALQVRTFLINSLEDMRIRLSSPQAKEIEAKIAQLNQALIQKSLALDLDKTTLSDNLVRFARSTEDVEKVLERFTQSNQTPEATPTQKEKKPKTNAVKKSG
jgi:hypothetical protein